MTKYEIDYEYGVADFWTEAVDYKEVEREFRSLASDCFGIRKSLGETSILAVYPDAELPLPFRGHSATHLLTHHGDEILFDRHFECSDGTAWKLHSEGGEWCSCRERGKAELACSVHHFWVDKHDTLCSCQKKEEKA